MKTLIISALVASAALTGAASAQVGSGAAAAIAHFNQDIDSVNDKRTVPTTDGLTTVSTRSGALSVAYEILNGSQDSQADKRGLNGATLVSGEPAFGAEIFERLRAESLEDE